MLVLTKADSSAAFGAAAFKLCLDYKKEIEVLELCDLNCVVMTTS